MALKDNYVQPIAVSGLGNLCLYRLPGLALVVSRCWFSSSSKQQTGALPKPTHGNLIDRSGALLLYSCYLWVGGSLDALQAP